MRMIMVGKTGCLPRAAEMLSPRSMSAAASLDGFFHDDVADGLGDDLQHFQDGHAAADQRGQGAGEAGQADLVGDGAEDGQLDAVRVPELAGPVGVLMK